MTATYGQIHQHVTPDHDHDSGNAVGVTAFTTIEIPYGHDTIDVRIESPGLWGIKLAGDGSDEPWLNEVFQEETDVLIGMLRELGATHKEAMPA